MPANYVSRIGRCASLLVALAMLSAVSVSGDPQSDQGPKPAPQAKQEQAKAKKKAPKVKRKAKSAADDQYVYIEVTGSHIRQKVKKGQNAEAAPHGNVIVIDRNSTLNRGYGSTMDALARYPMVYRGTRGY